VRAADILGASDGNPKVLRLNAEVVACGDAPALAVAQHQRARARQVAQRFQGALGLLFLKNSNRQDDKDRGKQHRGFTNVAECQVNQRAGHQQQEHRLTGHADSDGEGGSARCRREFVITLAGEPFTRIGRREPGAWIGRELGAGRKVIHDSM